MICLLTWLTIVSGRFAASSRYCVGEIFKSFLLVICCVIPSFLTHPRQPPFSVVGLYVAFPSGRNVVCTPPTDTKRFKPATQHNYPLALHGISLLTPHRYSRLSMQKAFFEFSPFAKSSGYSLSRVSIAEWSSQVARLVTKRSLVQIRLPRPNRSLNHCLSGKQKDCEGFPGRKIARLEVRTVSQ